ncbi:MAG: 30S ribosomal protein S6 [Desulfosalsimonadaceae bacterium]|nr:30S ribosomal protein S6 [Desulfosalsimonadaceae bacterium]
MNHYETIFIVDPDTPGTDQDTIFDKVKNMIERDGKLLMFDDWGNRKLAYEIKKKRQGRYVRLDYCGNGGLVEEMERTFRLDFRILKFMTILLAQDVDPEALMPVAEPVIEPAATEPIESKEVSPETEEAPDETPSETTEPETDTEE